MKIEDIKQFIIEHWQHPEIKYPIITAVVVSGLYMLGASWIFSAVTLGIIYSVPLIRFLHEFSTNTLDILHNVNTTTEHASEVAKEAKKTVKTVRKETLGEVGKNLDNITYPWSLPGRALKYVGSFFSHSPEPASSSAVIESSAPVATEQNTKNKEKTSTDKPLASNLSEDSDYGYYDDDLMVLYNCGTRVTSGLYSGLNWLWNKARRQPTPASEAQQPLESSQTLCASSRPAKRINQFSK